MRWLRFAGERSPGQATVSSASGRCRARSISSRREERRKLVADIFNGELLRVARQYRGIDGKELAAVLSVDPATISRAENSVSLPADAMLTRAADKLMFPREFFFQPDRLNGLPLSTHPQWRKRKSVVRRAVDRVLADFNIRIFHLRRLLRSLEYQPKLPIPQYDVDDYEGDVEKIAGLVRRAWKR